MSPTSVTNKMEEHGKVSDGFSFKRRNVRKQAARKRKGIEEKDRT
jgi:hypothetical protein